MEAKLAVSGSVDVASSFPSICAAVTEALSVLVGLGEEFVLTEEPSRELELFEGDNVRLCQSLAAFGDEVLSMRFPAVEPDPSTGLFIVDCTITCSVVVPLSRPCPSAVGVHQLSCSVSGVELVSIRVAEVKS